MRLTPRTKVKQDNQRGAEVMSYLFDEYAANNPDVPQGLGLRNPDGGANIPSTNERVEFVPHSEEFEDDNGHKLRLLNKFSNEETVEEAIAADDSAANTDNDESEEDLPFFRRPIQENVRRYRDFVKYVPVDSALTGLGLAGATYALGNFFNPVDDESIREDVAKIIRERKLPVTAQTVAAVKKEALKKAKRRKLLFAGAVGLGGAALNSWYHYIPGRPQTLYKWSSALDKRASMLDPNSFMDINEVKASVMDSSMTDGNKFLAMNMLDSINKPMVSSNDIIGAAINTGVSAVGSPIGRYTVSAATNAALGYGAGKLLGISRPDRLAATMGIGSFVMDSLQPNYNMQ